MITVNYQSIKKEDNKIVIKIKDKLNANGGRTLIPLYSGDLCEIGFDPNGKGLHLRFLFLITLQGKYLMLLLRL
jgi:hypothetical protein